MKPKTIKWDGSHLPQELKKLPPGRYVIEPIDPFPTLTPAEEEGIIEGLEQLDAGRGLPLVDVIREIRGFPTK